MATITAPASHQLQPLSFTTGDWPRYEFWGSNLQPIFSFSLVAYICLRREGADQARADTLLWWLLLALCLIQIPIFFWKIRSSVRGRQKAENILKDLLPRLAMPVQSRSRPLWVQIALLIFIQIVLWLTAWMFIRILMKPQRELSMFWFAIGAIWWTGMFLTSLTQIVVELRRIGKTPAEEFRFYDAGLVWANRPQGWFLKHENDFFPWSSITGITWRKPENWLPATLEIHCTDPRWDRWISFKMLSEEDRETLLSNLDQYVSVTRE